MSKNRYFIPLLTKLIFIFFAASILFAGVTGTLTGKIYDAERNDGLPGVTVTLKTTDLSAISNKHGQFTIQGIPPGVYEASIQHIGYASINCSEIIIKADITTVLDFGLKLHTSSPPRVIEMKADNLIYREIAGTTHFISSKYLQKKLPADNVLDALTFIPGVFNQHIRGSRREDVVYLLDGKPVISGFSRELLFNVPLTGIEDIVVHSGGYSTEYGYGSAGVVNIIRKRGRNQFNIDSRISTDYLGSSTRNHDNYRKFETGFGGPMTINFDGPELDMNYFVSFDLTATDTHQRNNIRQIFPDNTIYRNVNSSIITDISLGKNSNLSLQSIFSNWDSKKLIDYFSPYANLHSRVRETKRWSTFIDYAFNSGNSFIFNTSFGFNQNNDQFKVSAVTTSIDTQQTVIFQENNNNLWLYDIKERNYHFQANFLKHFNQFMHLKLGVSSDLYKLDHSTQNLLFYTALDSSISLNPIESNYNKNPHQVSGYGEVGLDFNAVIFKLGGRWEYFNPRTEINTQSNGEVRELSNLTFYKTVFSPRIFVSFPISSNDHIYLNYGEYAALPGLAYLYSGDGMSTIQAADTPLLGNPDINFSVNKKVELAFRKRFADNLATRFSFYIGRLENQLTTGVSKAFDPELNVARYLSVGNSKYSGFEFELEHDFTNKLSVQSLFTNLNLSSRSDQIEQRYYSFLQSKVWPEQSYFTPSWGQKVTLQFNLFYRFYQNFNLSIYTKSYSPRTWQYKTRDASNDIENIDWLTLADMRMDYKITLGRYTFGPFLEIKNLFNEKFATSAIQPVLFDSPLITNFHDESGRRIRLGLELR